MRALAFLLVLCVGTAVADLGPKPSMTFRLTYKTTRKVRLVSGQQMQCPDATGAGAQPLGEYGPQRFHADQDRCGSMAYGYAPYQKLVLTFDDRVRESPVFPARSGDQAYEVEVTDTGLVLSGPQITERQVRHYGRAFAVTLVTEVIVALVFLWFCRLPFSILIAVVLANLISVTTIWLVLPRVGEPSFWAMEAGVVIFEAAFVFALNHRRMFVMHAPILAVVMNVASVVAGFFLQI